eukprot:TRINITY_DN48291_c0_g1_i1.p1 TRINITY_DN48291_c0_g1~~TRINITY_DN48291_c0_g1_i1.p1  ORF type:complete len:397 (+),score=18.91 TRINITY_DN48291_c0_g1_i1:36-1226(+)
MWCKFGSVRGLTKITSRQCCFASDLQTSHDISLVESYAKKKPTFIRVKAALQTAENLTDETLIKSAETVRTELVVRIAHTIRNLLSLPFVVGINPCIAEVYRVYWDTFHALRVVEPITNIQQEKEFTESLERLFAVNSETVSKLSRGIKEVRGHKAEDFDEKRIDDFVTKFMYQRLSRRIMASHHIAFHHPTPGWCGIFNMNMSIHDVVKRVLSIVSEMCSTHYGIVPPVEIVGDLEAKISYVPGHLEYMLMELFKNAMRAVSEEHGGNPSMPPIIVRLCPGKNRDVTVCISDRGGGVPAAIQNDIWRFGFTSVGQDSGLSEAKVSVPNFFDGLTAPDHRGPSHFAGYGFGLPTCRVYAGYLGGDVTMVNIEGYGAEVYLHLNSVNSPRALESLRL